LVRRGTGITRARFPPWFTLTNDELNAIVDQAHNVHHIKVTAYLGDDEGAQRALDAGVDEWAHMPCDLLSTTVIAEAGAKKIYSPRPQLRKMNLV
jgi:imidazolonepropionase-like amidohydrolase